MRTVALPFLMSLVPQAGLDEQLAGRLEPTFQAHAWRP
jgi:hypothetical protein